MIEKIKNQLHKCKEASKSLDPSKLLHALCDMESCLFEANNIEDDVDSNTVISYELLHDLNTIIHTNTSTEKKIFTKLEDCLLTLQKKIVLLSANRCFLEIIASAKEGEDKIMKNHQFSLLACLRTCKRILLPSTESITKYYSDLSSSSSSEQEELAKVIVMLPIRASSALFASKFDYLPSWIVRTNYYPILVKYFCISSSRTSGRSTLLLAVLKLMIRFGGTEDIAKGFYEAVNFLKQQEEICGDIEPLSEMMSNIAKNLNVITSPNEKTKLLRSILYHISARHHNKKNVFETKMIPDLELLCIPFFHSTSSSSENIIFDGSIGNTLMHSIVLSPCPTDCSNISISWSMSFLFFKASHSPSITDDVDKKSNQYQNFISKYLEIVSQIWSQSIFIHRTEISQQHFISEFLLYSFEILVKEQKQDTKDNDLSDKIMLCIPNLIQGVTLRLESSIPQIRKHGMKMAQAFSPLVGQEIQFDELLEEEKEADQEKQEEEQNKDCSIPQSPEENNTDSIQPKNQIQDEYNKKREEKRKKPKRKPKQHVSSISTTTTLFDPDEEYHSSLSENDVSDSEGDDDDNDDSSSTSSSHSSNQSSASTSTGSSSSDSYSSSSEESSYIGYETPSDDEEDLREVRLPIYLSECLSYLRSSDKDLMTQQQKHKAALDQIPLILSNNIYASNPTEANIELTDLAVPLTLDLLYMENKSEIPELPEKRFESMLRIMVHEPQNVGVSLIDELDNSSCSAGLRLEILDILSHAAEELSGDSDLRKYRQLLNGSKAIKNNNNEKSLQSIEKMTNNEDSLAAAKPKTRRWGRRKTPEILIKNKLTLVAPLLFYSLLQKFQHTKTNTSIWAGSNGVHFLSKFIHTLATIAVHASSFSTSLLSTNRRMSKDLITFAWEFKESSSAEIRQSVFFALIMGTPLMSEEEFMTMSGIGITSLLEVSEQSMIKDPDIQCRKLASILHGGLTQVVKELSVFEGGLFLT